MYTAVALSWHVRSILFTIEIAVLNKMTAENSFNEHLIDAS